MTSLCNGVLVEDEKVKQRWRRQYLTNSVQNASLKDRYSFQIVSGSSTLVTIQAPSSTESITLASGVVVQDNRSLPDHSFHKFNFHDSEVVVNLIVGKAKPMPFTIYCGNLPLSINNRCKKTTFRERGRRVSSQTTHDTNERN